MSSLLDKMNTECFEFNIKGWKGRTLPIGVLEQLKDEHKFLHHADINELVRKTINIVEKRGYVDDEKGLVIDTLRADIVFISPDGTKHRHRVRSLFFFIVEGEYGYGKYTLRAPEDNPNTLDPDKLRLVPTHNESIKGRAEKKDYKRRVQELTGGVQ